MRVIAVANQKGGVGKTTTSVNLAASLAATRRRVLLVDLDPQGNATMGVGVDKHALDATARDVLLERVSAAAAVLQLEALGLALIPGNGDLTEAEVRLRELPVGDFALKGALAPLADDYDYVLLDCPPALSKLTVNALVAADGVLVPMQCEYYALEGLSALMDTVEKIRRPDQPAARDRRPAAHHVRPAQQPLQRRFRAAADPLRRQGLSHHHSAQRTPGRSAQPRAAGAGLRSGVDGSAVLPGAGRGDAEAPRRRPDAFDGLNAVITNQGNDRGE
jgi:chromosome segregation ATPase